MEKKDQERIAQKIANETAKSQAIEITWREKIVKMVTIPFIILVSIIGIFAVGIIAMCRGLFIAILFTSMWIDKLLSRLMVWFMAQYYENVLRNPARMAGGRTEDFFMRLDKIKEEETKKG